MVAQTPRDTLMIIIAEIPAVMQQYDILKAQAGAQKSTFNLESVRSQYLDLIRRMITWHETCPERESFRNEPSKLWLNTDKENGADFTPHKRCYSSVAVAETEIIWATVQLLLHLELLDLAGTLAWARDNRPSEPIQDESQGLAARIDSAQVLREVMNYVDIILQSLEYFLEDEAGVLAASFTVFPAMVAITFLQKMEDPRVDFVLALAEAYQRRTAVRFADLVMEGLNIRVRQEGQTMRWEEIKGSSEGEVCDNGQISER